MKQMKQMMLAMALALIACVSHATATDPLEALADEYAAKQTEPTTPVAQTPAQQAAQTQAAIELMQQQMMVDEINANTKKLLEEHDRANK